MNRSSLLCAAVAAAAGLAPTLAASPAAAAEPAGTTRVSVAAGGTQADGSSLASAISANGRYVAFDSTATNLVPGDTNGVEDVFLHDRRRGTTTRISVSGTGAQGDNGSSTPSISANGRYVAFGSYASNLVPGDTNGSYDVFVHDTRTGTTERISVPAGGGETDGDSFQPSITADGRYVVYETYASNLVPGAGPGNVLRHDRRTGRTTVVSVRPDGQPAGESWSGTVSPNGRYVAFTSMATTLVPGGAPTAGDVYLRDLVTGTTVRASVADDEAALPAGSRGTSVADNGSVGFWSDSPAVAGDTNDVADAFVRDTAAGTTVRVSVSSAGGQAGAPSDRPELSADGRFVVFGSYASNLVGSDTNGELFDVFRHELATGRTTLISRSTGGDQGDLDSFNPRITPDGRTVVFGSYATNLVPGDTNGEHDIFVTVLAG